MVINNIIFKELIVNINPDFNDLGFKFIFKDISTSTFTVSIHHIVKKYDYMVVD